jgi:hypothetical protein
MKAIHDVWRKVTGTRPISLDLSQVRFLEPYDLVYLCLLTEHLLRSDDSVGILLPEDRSARKYLERMRVIDRLTGRDSGPRQTFAGTSLAGGDVIQILQRPGEDLADANYDMFLRWLTCDPSLSSSMNVLDLLDAFCEMVSNFGYHAGGETAYFAGQYYPRAKRFRMAIGDLGIGIRASLSSNPQYAAFAERDDKEAIAKSLEPGVYGGKIGGGMGFPSLCDLVDKHNGELYITSGSGRLIKYAG